MSRRALLIGASDYGEGFVSLPAAEQDTALMRRALEGRGYTVQTLEPAVVRNTADLARAIGTFCRDAGDGVSIVYFSGHGMAIERQDWIIPAGVSRDEALTSANQRISTDLTPFIDPARAGLVLFIIDACRDPSDDSTAKGDSSWGHAKLASDESRLIRLFGCSAGEVCHVLRKGHEGRDVSVFTKAVATALAPEARSETLQELLKAAEVECGQIAATARPRLERQRPRFDIRGDISPDTLELLNSMPVFRRPQAESRSGGRAWDKFDPARLHCVVVASEHASCDTQSIDQLADKVRDVFLAAGGDIWRGFRAYWHGRGLVDGTMRALADSFEASRVVTVVLPVTQAFAAEASLDEAVVAIAQADLAFFDVTRFEPGVMFLLGIRAVAKRGVTICSHGYGWREGQSRDVPFNLSDLQIFAHDDDGEAQPGEDPVVARLVEAIGKGFQQLSRQPRYLDLPAFDALRELGPGSESSGTIPWEDLVLALCSFQREHAKAWRHVRRGLETALQDRGARRPRVRRLIDLGSPQVVSQSLYEHIRRVSACLMDWSLFSPSSFLELGVRLAVSPWGAVQIVEERFLPGAELALRIKHRRGEGARGEAEPGPELRQVGLMQVRLEPTPYRVGAAAPFPELADALISRRPFDEEQPGYNRIHRLVRQAVEPVSIAYPAVHEGLRSAADSLNDAKQDRIAASQVLFAGSKAIKQDRERAALEHRIAAWLYLEHRINALSLPPEDPLRKLHRELGQVAAAALYDSDRDEDLQLAMQIEKTLGGGPRS